MRALSVALSSSTATSAVIIFVSDAIGRERSGLWRHSTSPVSRFTSSPPRGILPKRIFTGSSVSSSWTSSGERAERGLAGRVRGAVLDQRRLGERVVRDARRARVLARRLVARGGDHHAEPAAQGERQDQEHRSH